MLTVSDPGLPASEGAKTQWDSSKSAVRIQRAKCGFCVDGPRTTGAPETHRCGRDEEVETQRIKQPPAMFTH